MAGTIEIQDALAALEGHLRMVDRRLVERDVSSARVDLDRARMSLAAIKVRLLDGYVVVDPLREREAAYHTAVATVIEQLAVLASTEGLSEAEPLYSESCPSLTVLTRRVVEWLGRANTEGAHLQRMLGSNGREIALANAEMSLSVIGRDSDVRHFLRAGAASRSDAFRAACCQIAAALGIPLIALQEHDTQPKENA